MLARLLLPMLALLLLIPVVSADSYACATNGTTNSGQIIIFHEDPLTVGVVSPVASLTTARDENAAPWVGVSVYPMGNGPCLVVEDPRP